MPNPQEIRKLKKLGMSDKEILQYFQQKEFHSKVSLMKGEKGEDGKDGENGKDGKDGRDGKDGKNGKDGKRGPKGDRGPRGPVGYGFKGEDGKDSDPIEVAKIVLDKIKLEKPIKNVLKDFKIDASQIKGLPEPKIFKKFISGGGSSGVQILEQGINKHQGATKIDFGSGFDIAHTNNGVSVEIDLSEATLPNFTQGSVLFGSGTGITEDNANFFWDDTNNRLGIRVNTPTKDLDVNGEGIFADQLQVTGSAFNDLAIAGSADTNTGLFWDASDSLGVVTGGSTRITVGNTYSTFSNFINATSPILLTSNGAGILYYDSAESVYTFGISAGSSGMSDGDVYIGHDAGGPGGFNVAVGFNALQGLVSNSVAVGYQAGENALLSQLTAIGYQSATNAEGENVTAIGDSSAYNSIATFSTMVGADSGYSSQGSLDAFGIQSGHSSTGLRVVAMGTDSLYRNSGNNNTALGYQAGYHASVTLTGSDNLFLGRGATYGTAGLTNATAIGDDISATQSNAIVFSTDQDMGLGTLTPSAKLHLLKTTEQLRIGYDASNYWSYTVASDGGLTIANAGTDGDINFDLSGATDGDFSVNTNHLFVDTSTGNVGVRTNSPDAMLEIFGEGEIATFRLDNDFSSFFSGGSQLQFFANSSPAASNKKNFAINNFNPSFAGGENEISIQSRNDDGSFKDTLLRMTQDTGYMGIGTSQTPTNRLQIRDTGTIGASNMSNAWVLIGTQTAGVGFDSNEIMSVGSAGLLFGTVDNNPVRFYVNGVERGSWDTNGFLNVTGVEGGNAELLLDADQGDDNADTWRLQSNASTNNLNFLNHTSVVGSLSSAGTQTRYGGIVVNTTTVTSTSYTILSTDEIIEGDDDTAGSAITMTLPAIGTTGQRFTITKEGTTANVIIDGNGSETINGATTFTLTTQYESITLYDNGTEWRIIEA